MTHEPPPDFCEDVEFVTGTHRYRFWFDRLCYEVTYPDGKLRNFAMIVMNRTLVRANGGDGRWSNKVQQAYAAWLAKKVVEP